METGTSFTSILFAYVVAAYFVGAKLSHPQLFVISALMLWHCALNITSIMTNMQTMIIFHEMERSEWGEPALRNLEVGRMITGAGGVWSVVAAFYFMWSIRLPKTE